MLFGGSIFGRFAGVHYWWPNIFGRLLSRCWAIPLASASLELRPDPGALINLEQVVLGGLLTLGCIARFALEYHRQPSGYEVRPP